MNKKFLIAGLHDAGKTTYIAALWYMINNYDENSRFILSHLASGDDEYLNEICEKWMSCERLQRTSYNKKDGEPVTINVKDRVSNASFNLDIPDFSGEAFEHHFEFRDWDKKYRDTLNDIEGIVLFVNASDEKNTPKLLQNDAYLAGIFGHKPSNNGVKIIPWEASHTSNQVKLVEAFQFLETYSRILFPIKISVVISAWDIVEQAFPKGIHPEKWFKNHVPLLYQYLSSNADLYQSKYFGVSAQGGPYAEGGNEKLAEMTPTERVRVTDGDGITNEIFKPILWLLE